MDSRLTLTIKCIMEQRATVQTSLEYQWQSLGSCRSSWGKREEIAKWFIEHGIKQDERGWHFTQQDEKDRDAAVAGYEQRIKELRAQLVECDQAILTVLQKWQA